MAKDKIVIYRDVKPIENLRSTIYCPLLYDISCASMKGSYTLGCSLTDSRDPSYFLVLVSFDNCKAQCHLLEFRRNATSHGWGKRWGEQINGSISASWQVTDQ